MVGWYPPMTVTTSLLADLRRDMSRMPLGKQKLVEDTPTRSGDRAMTRS